MHIRPAKEVDFPAILQLENTCWTPQTSPFYNQTLDTEALIAEQKTGAGRLVAVNNDKLLGTLSYNPYYPFAQGKHVVTFGLLVNPQNRRQGVGQALLQHFLTVATQEGYNKVAIHVTGGNHAAMAFYEQAGFSLEGQLRGHFRIAGQEQDDLIYGKTLRKDKICKTV